jgi:hypothetical protein
MAKRYAFELHDSEGLVVEMVRGSDYDAVSGALQRSREHISATPHGDNCHLTDEFPGNRCVCGKESILDFIDSQATSGAEHE